MYSIKKNKNFSKVCEETICSYINHMEMTLSPHFSKRYYFGVPAPVKITKMNDQLDLKRIEMIKIYNSFLKKYVLSIGCYFLDIYQLTANKNGENNNLHMIDQTHLSPKCLSKLFKYHLHKP